MDGAQVPDDVATVLLEEPPLGGSTDACRRLLFDRPDASALYVSYTDDPAAYARRADAMSKLAVITVGEDPRTAPEGVHHEHVSTPSDLTGLSIAIDESLAALDPPIRICFDSVTAMLQYVEFATAYEFLHVIASQIQQSGARVHFHVDPQAHDEQSLAALTSLVEARVSAAEGTVQSRPSD